MVVNHDVVALEMCLSHACSWEAYVEGPIPLGSTDPLVVHVACIIRPTREEAIECVYLNVEQICAESSFPFDPDEWTLCSLRIVNGN